MTVSRYGYVPEPTAQEIFRKFINTQLEPVKDKLPSKATVITSVAITALTYLNPFWGMTTAAVVFGAKKLVKTSALAPTVAKLTDYYDKAATKYDLQTLREAKLASWQTEAEQARKTTYDAMVKAAEDAFLQHRQSAREVIMGNDLSLTIEKFIKKEILTANDVKLPQIFPILMERFPNANVWANQDFRITLAKRLPLSLGQLPPSLNNTDFFIALFKSFKPEDIQEKQEIITQLFQLPIHDLKNNLDVVNSIGIASQRMDEPYKTAWMTLLQDNIGDKLQRNPGDYGLPFQEKP